MRRLAAALLCLADLSAQDPPAGPPPTTQGPAAPAARPQEPPTERTFRGAYDERQSRSLFAACDADGNDRLDIFEVSQSLDAVRNPQDDAFLRLDHDRDGYLNWPEFDAYYKRTLLAGISFRVRPLRKSVLPQPEARPSSPLQRFLQLHDKNRNGGLDPAEIDQFLQKASLPPALATQMRTLDVDRSGRVDASELAPWFELLPGQTAAAIERGVPSSRLPAPWSHVDDDANNMIDPAELTRLLGRLDLRLTTWSTELHRRWDSNRDGLLQQTELLAIGVGATAPAPGQLPK